MCHKRVLRISSLLACGVLLYGCISENHTAFTRYQAYPITVDYGQSIEDSIKAGSYYRVYSEISSKNFLSDEVGTNELSVRLVRLRNQSAISEVLKAQAKNGLRPATIKELLAFGMTYPELKNKVAIVGLGSYREYYVTTYKRWSMLPNDVDEVSTLERFYPCLDSDIIGNALTLIQEDMIPSYNPSGFYGCFVAVD